MAFFTLDQGQPVDKTYVVNSLLMSGFVANTVLFACARAIAPWFGFPVYDPISAAFSGLRQYDLIAAEVMVFLALAAILPSIYVFVWRSIASQILETRNWLIHSVGFGMVLSGFVTMMIKLFVISPSVSIQTLSPLAISIVVASFSLSGMIRLRELNQIEI
ncbi:MAG: hypothetical protein ABJN04_13695 [Hyphomicrobiales bacterium]